MANDVYCVNDGKPYFSSSPEHGNEPLCASCYKKWLEDRDQYELQQSIEKVALLQAKIETRQKIAAEKAGAKK